MFSNTDSSYDAIHIGLVSAKYYTTLFNRIYDQNTYLGTVNGHMATSLVAAMIEYKYDNCKL